MEAGQLFPCFGISGFGQCPYNPANPANVYFTMGNAASVLAFTFAVQVFLRPIFRFRLRSYGVNLSFLFSLVFAGFFCTIVASILPFFNDDEAGFIRYPIAWEILGALFVGIAYLLSAFIVISHARIYDFNCIAFLRAGASLLASADDADRVSFSEDLLRNNNLSKIITYAQEFEKARSHELMIEFQRLKELGRPMTIQGNPPVSAFYRFTRRVQLERAGYALTFVRILADPHLCAVIVQRCPWLLAGAISHLNEHRIHVDGAEYLFQELAAQTIINRESMIEREADYDGFGAVRLLSNSLFGLWFILRHYRPLAFVSLKFPESIDDGCVRRLNHVARAMFKTALANGDYFDIQYIKDIEHLYHSLSLRIATDRQKDKLDLRISKIYDGIEYFCKDVAEKILTLKPDAKRALFVSDTKVYRNDIVHITASIVFDGLSAVSNTFTGFDDHAWTGVIGLFQELYPFHDDQKGMDPLQQQLALKLMKKLRENISGYYPAISRVLLSIIGPYNEKGSTQAGNAYSILKDVFYLELKNLPQMINNKTDALTIYFPENVKYDVTTNTLTHTYRGGPAIQTALSNLVIPEIDLCQEQYWRVE